MTRPSPFKRFWETLRTTGKRFMEVEPMTEASSLAFTTIFAVPGIFIITLTVASWFYDPGDVRKALYSQTGSFIGSSTKDDLEKIVSEASEKKKTGLFARIAGIVALVISSTAAFASLQSSLNKVWRVEAKKGKAIVRYLLTRARSLALIGAFGFLLLVTLVLDAAIVAIGERMGGASEKTVLAGIAGLLASFGVVTLIFAGVFKFLPDVRVRWRSIWVGALFTAALFSLGKYLIGLYIAKSGVGDAFGAGGAVIIIMLWVYYSAVLLLFGAQYTQVVSTRDEGPVSVEPQARPVPQKA